MSAIHRAAAALEGIVNDASVVQTTPEVLARVVIEAALDVDELSNVIRTVDGDHSSGAGALAEAIHDALLGGAS